MRATGCPAGQQRRQGNKFAITEANTGSAEQNEADLNELVLMS